MVKHTMMLALGLPNGKRRKGEYGIEVEAEGTHLPAAVNQAWSVEVDHSLASGLEAREYVMTAPASLEGCRTALDDLARVYAEHNTVVEETDTSGVHVHVNVQEYTPRELFTFIITYLVLEELLVTYCGDMRQGNHFCLRTIDAEGLVYELTQSAINRKFGNLNMENIRYSSLNVLSLFKYGSVEFRAMRGTPNLDAIYEWVEILDRVKKGAKQFATPYDVIFSMSANGEKNFINMVLDDKAKIFTKVKGCEAMVRNAAQRVQALAFVPDWKAWKDQKVNPFPATGG